jgi:uncharacterized membrane protein
MIKLVQLGCISDSFHESPSFDRDPYRNMGGEYLFGSSFVFKVLSCIVVVLLVILV